MRPGVPEVKLSELYQEVVLDHNKNPRHYGKLADATCSSHGINPLCGDNYYLYLKLNGGKIEKIGFEGSGCAISKSSASLLTTAVEGKSIEEAEALKQSFVELLTKESVSEEARSRVGRLKFYEGVRQFPVRVKCATLIWHALGDALKDKKE